MSRVFWTFIFCGTFGSCLVFWTTQRLYLFVEGVSYEDVLPIGIIGALLLTCAWILPAQTVVAIVATIFFSFFKRIPLWFVIVVVTPICGLLVTYAAISDRYDAIQRSDFRKLLYWTLVVAPGELLSAGLVSRATNRSSKDVRAGINQ